MEFLDLAAELAEKVNWRDVYPNPRVGCVIARNGDVVATGVHEKYGSAHAEVMAIENFKLQTSNFKLQTSNNEKFISGVEVYVTLEPCDHFLGKKTGSCTQKLIELHPNKVVIGVLDKRFCGKNVEKLKAAGIKVEVINHEKSEQLSRAKPYVILKMAQTLDGKIGETSNYKLQTSNRTPVYISSFESRKKVHQLRSQVDGILTTTETIITDDPILDCRLVNKNIAQNLFVFGKRTIPQNAHIFLSSNREIKFLTGEDLSRDLREISEMGVKTLLTECGSKMATSLLKENLVDEILLFIAPRVSGKGISTFREEISFYDFSLSSVERVDGDVVLRFIKIFDNMY